MLCQGFLKPEEKGSDGSCFFHSIGPHIGLKDFEVARQFCLDHQIVMPLFKNNEEFNWNYQVKPGTPQAILQAHQLRLLAMAVEENFFQTVSQIDNADQLSEDDLDWIDQFYKDMKQEIENKSTNDVKQETIHVENQTKFDYFKKNFQAYKKATSRPNNWAGTSEAIAFSRVFNRPIELFGNDRVSLNHTPLDQEGNLLPYYQRKTESLLPSISIFQCGGGGHYQFLPHQVE